MTENATKEKSAAPARPIEQDLSKEIEQLMERHPEDRLKVVRLFGDCYRCNWWVRDKTPHPFWLAGGTIRKSEFLRAKKTGDRVLIERAT